MADEWDQIGVKVDQQPMVTPSQGGKQAADDPWAQVGETVQSGTPPSDASSIQQATSASAAAVADNSWFSPEFRSGKWYNDVILPAATAAQTAARVAGRAMGPFLPGKGVITTLEPGVTDYASTATMGVPPQKPGETTLGETFTGIPPYVQQALKETMTEAPIPKEAYPMHWYGKGVQKFGEIFNPQGPPAAQALRTGLEYFGGGLEKTSDAIAGMMSPLNLGIMFSPELLPLRYAPAAHKLLAAGFLLDAFSHFPEQWQRFQAAKTPQEKGGIVGETLVSLTPAAGLFGRGRVLAGRRGATTEEAPATEPVGTGEAASEAPTLTKDEFRGWAQGRLNQLTQLDRELTPVESAEAKDLQEGLAEGGDINALALKQQVELSDVTPAPEAAAEAPKEEAAPAAAAEPAPADAGATARFKGEHPEQMTRSEFTRGLQAQREALNAKSPLTDEDIVDITDIDNALESAANGQTGRMDKLAWDKYGLKLTEGGEESALKPGNAQIQIPPASRPVKEGAAGAEPTAGSGDNVVGETQGAEAGGSVPPETPAEPVVAPVGPAIPGPIEDAIAAAEQSAAGGDHGAAIINLDEAKRLLRTSKKLPKDVKDAVLSRIAKVEHVVGGKTTPPPSTAETADPNVVTYDGKTYYRSGYDEKLGVGIWHKDRPAERGGRKVGNTGTATALDNIWEARRAIAETAKEEAAAKLKAAKEKKAASKTESTAASVPTTGETPSREEIGKGEAQPPPPGTKVQHWDYGEGEVVGPGKKEGTVAVKFPDGRTMNFDPDVVRQMAEATPKAEAPPAKPDPAAQLRKQIEDLQAKIIDDKNRKASVDAKGKRILSPKEIVALEKSIKKDQLALNKLKNKADKLPKPTVDTSALTEKQMAEREIFRKSLADRVKKEKFPKKDILVPSSTGGEPTLIKASTYRGLQIYKKQTNIKPWQVIHEGSGNLLGHFDTEADAKAFAVRIHEGPEGSKFDFTRSWDSVKIQRQIFGTARFKEMVADPYAFLADAGARIKARANKIGGYINVGGGGPDLQLLDSAREFGSRLYQRGISFRDWAVNMVKHLGEKIVGHLREIWDSVTGRNTLPHAMERGGASPGGGSFKAQEGQVSKDFATRAEADAFIKTNKNVFQSHQVIEQSGSTIPVRVIYRPKPPPGSGAAQPKPIVTKSGAVIQPKYNPSVANAPPVVNSGTGGTTKPPPPGSALGPTPAGSNPGRTWWDRLYKDWDSAWKRFRPAAYAAFKMEPSTPVMNVHERWIGGPTNLMFQLTREDLPGYKKAKALTLQEKIDWEHDARTKFNAFRAAGQGELQATLNAIKGNPLRDYFVYRRTMEPQETGAAGGMNVKLPGRIEGPYLPRLTEEQDKLLLEIGRQRGEGVVAQLRRSLSTFDKSRKYETMKEGIAAGVRYKDPLEAIIQRERTGAQLIATAKALKELEAGGVIYRTYDDALKNSKDGKVVEMTGFGGDTWFIRNGHEAQFIEQNMNNAGMHSPWGTLQQVMNNYARNPNLINPLPHITKNMGFKYILARINNLTLKRDTNEFRNATNPQLLAEFKKVFYVPEQTLRMRQIVAGEKTDWFSKITQRGLAINEPSQKYIFEKADPAMRYALWKSYIRKGMDYQEAANHVHFDLIRYDENSGALNFYKSIPGNFFSTWRVGTYVTMYKALTTHPIRTLLFFGAVEYLREAIYRHSGQWTHLPIDYADSPLAELVLNFFKAKKEVELGRNPATAYAGMGAKGAMIAASTAVFGPGGGQAPTTIKDAMGAFQGDEAAMARMVNMFWGLQQIFNIPGEMQSFRKDGDPKHLVNILTGAAFGTHAAIKYEPRRLGKWFPEWLPGMQYTPEQRAFGIEREKREAMAIKQAKTYEQRHGITRNWWQGSEESQAEDLLRGSGLLRDKRPRRAGGL